MHTAETLWLLFVFGAIAVACVPAWFRKVGGPPLSTGMDATSRPPVLELRPGRWTVDGVSYEVAESTDDEGRPEFLVRVFLPPSVAEALAAARTHAGPTGDGGFDRLHPDFVSAVAPEYLSASLRGRLRYLPPGTLRAESDAWTFAVEHAQDRPQRAVRILTAAVADLAVVPPSAALRDMGGAQEPTGVRLTALMALARRFPSEPETRRTLGLATVDEEPAVRLAALRLSLSIDTPSESLRRLRTLLFDPNDDVRALARVSLDPDTPESFFVEAVARARRSGVAPLDIVRTLDTVGRPSVEGALLRLLADEDALVGYEVAPVLARLGSLRSIEPLLALTKGLLRDSAVKQAATDAIAAIQNRLVNTDRGALSLVDHTNDSGALSIADDPGALSIVDVDGALSPAPDKAAPTPGPTRTRMS